VVSFTPGRFTPRERVLIFFPLFRTEPGDSSVGIATGYGLDDRMIRVRFPAGLGIFSTPCPYPLWASPSLLLNRYRGLFPWGQSGRGVKLTTHLHLISRSKDAWSYTYTSQYVFVAWCTVKHRDNFTFNFVQNTFP
jgi:hypothetical protein